MLKIINNASTKIISILWILALFINIFNSSVNLHSHKLDDGTIVTHAHPYNKTGDTLPFKSHKHTKLELLFLTHSQLLFLLFFTFTLLTFSIKTQIFVKYNNSLIYKFFHLKIRNKAPPFLNILS